MPLMKMFPFTARRRAFLVFGALALAAAIGNCVPSRADEPPVRWFKGNLHTHSLWSDGNDFPEMICDWYRARGYHFLALSDHNILSTGEKWLDEAAIAKRGDIGGLARYRERFGDAWVETRERNGVLETRLKTLAEFRPLFEKQGEFLLLQSEEITDSFKQLPVHINASNLAELIRPQGGESVRDVISRNLQAVDQQSRRLGRSILAHLNHPNFGYGVTAEDMAAVHEERFFEVYNGHPGVNHLGDREHASVERLWDIANTLRLAEGQAAPLYGLATDDSHNYFGERGASPGRGWVMVRAPELTAEAIVQAITRGDFYASSGVELNEIRFDDSSRSYTIEINAQPGASYTTQFLGTRKGFDARSEPAVDDQGKPSPATRRYSPEVGQVLATVAGPKATYTFTGDELYVRAVVTSDQAPENPSFDGQKQQAWTQPVGWRLAESKP